MVRSNVNVDYARSPLYHVMAISYEREYYASSSRKVSLRYKAGILSFDTLFGLRAGGVLVLGDGANHFDLAIQGYVGVLLLQYNAVQRRITYFGPYTKNEAPRFWPFVDLGYRYESPEGGFLARIYVGTSGIGVGLGWALRPARSQ